MSASRRAPASARPGGLRGVLDAMRRDLRAGRVRDADKARHRATMRDLRELLSVLDDE